MTVRTYALAVIFAVTLGVIPQQQCCQASSRQPNANQPEDKAAAQPGHKDLTESEKKRLKEAIDKGFDALSKMDLPGEKHGSPEAAPEPKKTVHPEGALPSEWILEGPVYRNALFGWLIPVTMIMLVLVHRLRVRDLRRSNPSRKWSFFRLHVLLCAPTVVLGSLGIVLEFQEQVSYLHAGWFIAALIWCFYAALTHPEHRD